MPRGSRDRHEFTYRLQQAIVADRLLQVSSQLMPQQFQSVGLQGRQENDRKFAPGSPIRLSS